MSCAPLKSLDMYKVEHNFFMFKNSKAKGKKDYNIHYGSHFGAILTIISYSIALMYFSDLLVKMMTGVNDTIVRKQMPNDFDDEEYRQF